MSTLRDPVGQNALPKEMKKRNKKGKNEKKDAAPMRQELLQLLLVAERIHWSLVAFQPGLAAKRLKRKNQLRT